MQNPSERAESLPDADLAIVAGPPLSEEAGLGALTLPGYLREVTQRYAEREALVLHGPDGVVRWSYRELWKEAKAVAKALVAGGVGKDARVAVLMTNQPEWLAAAFGVWLAGGVTVAISTFSTPPELEYQLQISGATALLFEGQVLKKDFAADLLGLEPAIRTARPGQLRSLKFPFLRHLIMFGGGEARGAIEAWPRFLARGAAEDDALIEAIEGGVQPTDAALVLFSSGSTGRPKAVLTSHRAVAIQMWRIPRLTGIVEDIRCWTPNGFFWSATIIMTIGNTFTCGGSIVIEPTFDADEALRLMQDERVTLPIARAHHWARMEQSPLWANADLSSIRYVHPATIIGRHPTVEGVWTNPMGSYGGTETFTFHTANFVDAPAEDAAVGNGRPLPGNQVKIIDPQTGVTLRRGERGEIATKGPTLMLGYLGASPEEYLDADGFFRSGDGGYIDEAGRLFFEGRLSEIIKTGGAKVSLMEVDLALGGCPGVKLGKSVGVPHETLDEMLVGCVVAQEGERPDEAAIRAFLGERLASYKVPKRILFLEEDEIPMTGTGKIRLTDLRKLAVERL